MEAVGKCIYSVPEQGPGKSTTNKHHPEVETVDVPEHFPYTVVPLTSKE